MVLFKRKGVSIPESKYVPEDEGQQVWVIPETHEFFCTYDEYLTRLDFYQQKKFICELSGASCLTYFDARKRELQETKNVLRFFPEPLKEPILRMVQFSQTTRLDQLVDEIHTTVKEKYFVGEFVSVRFEEQRVRAKVVKADHSKGLYQVDDGKRVLEGDSSQLIRDRKLLSKPALRAFVKHSAYREPWLGAPWMVKTEYADQYNISTDMPSDLQQMKDQSERFTAGGWSSGGGNGGASGNGSSNASTPSTTGKDHKGQSTVLNFKQLTQNYLDSRNKANKSLEEHLAPEFRQDDLFLLALSEEPLKNVINERCKEKPWPKWHEDDRLKPIEESKKVNHLFEIWLFSQFFSEFLDYTDLTTFDDFLSGLIAKEVSLPIERLHEAIFKLLVPEGGTELAIPLPEEEDEEEEERENEQNGDDEKDEEDEQKVEHPEPGQEIEQDEDGEEDDYEEENGQSDRAPPAKRKKINRNTKRVSEVPAWVEQIGHRDFTNGGWQRILADILTKLSHVREWHPDTYQVIKLLCPEQQEQSNELAQKAYSELPLTERVHALMMLVRLLYNSHELREFLDSQYEIASKLRRKPLAKELKQTREELKTAQRLLSMTIDGDETTSVSNDQIKTMVSELKLDPSFTVDQLKDLIKNLEDQHEKKLEESHEAAATIARLDNQRMRLLGKDRFFNRYWWMDSNGVDQSGGYFMGRLWVQGPSPEDLEYFLSSHYAEKFVEFRKTVTAEVTRVRQQAKERRREREKLARQIRQEKLQKIKQQNETHESRSHSNELTLLTERKPVLTEEDYSLHAAKTSATLNDLKQIEKRIRELIGVSQENGDLLSADETIELRQLEAEIIRINSLELSQTVPLNKRTVRELAESEEIITRLSSWFKEYFPSCKQSTEPASQPREPPYQGSSVAPLPGSLPGSLPSQLQITPSMQNIDQGVIKQQPIPSDPYQLSSLQQMQATTNAVAYANQSYPPQPDSAQQPMQWIVQQTTHGPMLYAIPIQQYQLLMQQYNALPPVAENSDAYHAYLQQLSMQQAYMSQLQYGSGYIPPPGQYGPFMMPYMTPQVPPQAYSQPFGAQISPQISQLPPQVQPQVEVPSQVQVPLTEAAQSKVQAAQPTDSQAAQAVIARAPQVDKSSEPNARRTEPARPVANEVSQKEVEEKPIDTQIPKISTGVKTETVMTLQPNPEYQSPYVELNSHHENSRSPIAGVISPQAQEHIESRDNAEACEGATIDIDAVEHERTPYAETEEQLKPLDLLRLFESNHKVLLPHQWRFYETPREVEQLLTYFFSLGNRETKLATAIRKAQPDINRIMNLRLRYIGKPEMSMSDNSTEQINAVDDGVE